MNPADEIPVKIDAPESTSAPVDFGAKMDEHPSAGDFERACDQSRPVEDLRSLLLRISHHLDYETSERSTIYYRLLAIDAQGKRIEKQTKRRAWRALFRYAIVICLAVAGTLAWESYGDAAKRVIATRAPELGWSPEAKETIATWIAQLGWTNASTHPDTSAVRQPVTETAQPKPVVQTASETLAPKAPPAVASVDPEQMQQITQSLAALQKTVEQLGAAQDQIGRQISALQTDDSEILKRVPAPPPLPTAAPVRKPPPMPLSRSPVATH